MQTYERNCHQLRIEPRSHPQADAFWVAFDTSKQPLGQCAVWWQQTPSYRQERVGLIGHYQAANAAVARSLLSVACECLAKHGCTIAIAPMDGNSWQRYRVVLEGETEPPFLLEPEYPQAVMTQLQDQGFGAIAQYWSGLNSDLTVTDPRTNRVRERLAAIGVQIRSLDLTHWETELSRIYPLILRCFRQHFLFRPIPESEFIGQYQSLLPYIQPEFVFIAEHQEKPVGVLFALPNWLEVRRGQALQTIILKTIAVLPERQYAGLGKVLIDQCHQTAAQAGYQRAIYALIQEQNPSLNLVRSSATTIRRYAVLAKAL